MSKRALVSVSRQSVTAIEEPRFLVEADGKLYMTMAVLEYDSKHPQITDEQREVIYALQEKLDGGRSLRAISLGEGALTDKVIAANTVVPPRR